jgi:hypothetical protein
MKLGLARVVALTVVVALSVTTAPLTAALQESKPPAGSPAATAKKEWRVEAIAAAADQKSTVPPEVPEPFAKLLAADGVRVVAPDSKPRAELWWRAALPLEPKATDGFDLGRVANGTFVAILRAPGNTSDYRDQAIEAGVYALRYFHQPADANHLGTSDSPDFLVLTSLKEEKSPDPVTTKEKLLELSVPISPSDHALVLYVTKASDPAPKDGAARVVKRSDHDEWALEVTLTAQATAAAAESLRIALVVEGHTAH